MVVPDASRFRRGACSKRSFGFSTQVRSGLQRRAHQRHMTAGRFTWICDRLSDRYISEGRLKGVSRICDASRHDVATGQI
jgi:hypothetical protein